MKPDFDEMECEEPQNFAPLATPIVARPAQPISERSKQSVSPFKKSVPTLGTEIQERQIELEANLGGNVHFKTQGNVGLAFKPFELEPSPIMSLYNRQGINTSTGEIGFSTDSNAIVLSGKTLLSVNTSNGHQRFLIGHDQNVAAFAVVPGENLLVSADEGETPEIIVWRIVPVRILVRFKANLKSVHSMDACKFTKDEK
jgi:hypothetical protein